MAAEPRLHEDLHASDARERQLWLLTLGLLLFVGIASIVTTYVVLDALLGDTSAHSLAFRMLIGLAILIGLFCAYVLHTRRSVGSVKEFLNEMSGMATGNLAVEECLTALVAGMARICRAPVGRILIARTTADAFELVSSFGDDDSIDEIGASYELDRIAAVREVLDSGRPAIVMVDAWNRDGAGPREGALFFGRSPEIDRALVIPLPTDRDRHGIVVVALPRRRIRTPWHDERLLETAAILGRHAGTVIEEAVRRREAICDPLTELYNRRHYDRRIQEELARAEREGHVLAMVLCDLDGFKQINDSRGHHEGDRVLRTVATVLRETTRGTDLHFRWGGDEFVVVLSKTSEEGAQLVAQRIREGVRSFATANELDLDVSIGIALYPTHGRTDESLIHVADLAMYVAKTSGDKIRVGTEEYSLDPRCVKFVYQPILDVAGDNTLGYEVFTRDPDGVLTPLELFRRYRAVGQLARLKRLIFDLQLERARAAGVKTLFLNTDLEFLESVDPVRLPPGIEAVLEISESDARLHAAETPVAVERWRLAGYRIALDDLGSGRISLALLTELAPDFVKIDRSGIVRAVAPGPYREFLKHVLRGFTAFVKGGVIAEGIERAAELDTARELGVGYVQGYLTGRPSESIGATPARRTGS